MAYDTFNYDIKSKLPEWWKEDRFLEPINRYSQKLIRDLVGGLLGSSGIVQPFQVWKTLPTEYSWTHTYQSHDSRLRFPEGGTSPLYLESNKPVRAYLPNSKRNCHGVIQLQLQGDQLGFKRGLEKITIKNGNQSITLNNITTATDIKILTESGMILVDGVERNDLVKGSFNKIYAQAQNTNYDELSVEDENKITFIEIESDSFVNFALQVKMIHPVYVTEQNIRIHTVSAFPIEWVKLYGFYCHEFNNKQEWMFLWEKHYRESDRVVYDRITKQFDCETFYIQVKLHGIGACFVYGFPQEEFSSNAAFQTNSNLDKWGRLYGLPRRFYKTHITEDEEPYTYPPFYNYEIEQDYWYEERLVNEYRHNDDAINATFIKDSDMNNIAILQCIDPLINDIYVYTETIKNELNNEKRTGDIYPTSLSESGPGVSWKTPHEIANSNTTAAEITLQPKNSESFNERLNQTKTLEIHFDDIPTLPKNINIKGIELVLNGLTDIHSASLVLDDRSQMLLPKVYQRVNGEKFKKIDHIQINNDIQNWEKGKGVYKIGGPNYLFNLESIKREELQDGITFNLGFTNENDFLRATVALYSIKLIIHYEIIYDSYDINVNLNANEIILDDPNKQEINMKINLKNTGEIPIVDKNIYIACAEGIEVTNKQFPTFDLDVDESFTIGESEYDKIVITPKKYSFPTLTKDSSISKEINPSEEDIVSFYYKTNGFAVLDIYINDEKKESLNINSNSWKKYSYRIFDTAEVSDISVVISELTDGSKVFFRNTEDWTYDQEPEYIEEYKTGFYDIVVFCDKKVIKKEITIKEVDLNATEQ